MTVLSGACSLVAALVVGGCTSTSDSGSASNGAGRSSLPSGAATAATPPATPTSTSVAPPSPVPTTTVPQSSTGNVDDTVPSRRTTTLAAVPLTAPAAFGSGVTGRIVSVRAVTTTTRLPGEVGGPAIAVTVSLSNRSARALSVADVVVGALDSTGAPASSVSAAPSRPFRGAIARGRTAKATYVFSMATDRRSPVDVTLSYSASAPTARFVGTVR